MKKLTFFLFGLIFLFLARPTSADTGFTLEPKNFFLQATPDKTIREVVTLKNLDSMPKSVSLTWQGYRLTGSEFTSDVERENHSINFARLNTEKLELQPQGAANVEIEFTVPKDFRPADYYGSLIATSENSQTQVAFTVRVLGMVEEKVKLIQFSTKGHTITLKIANQGSQTTNFKTSIKIQNLLGGTRELEPINGGLKAAEVKNFQIKHPSALPGLYQARINLEFGNQKQDVVFHSFWVHPEIFLFAGAIIVVAVMTFLFKRRKKRKLR